MIRYTLIMLIFGGILLTCGDVFLKYWSLKDKWWLFVLAMLLYLFGIALLGLTFKYRNFAVANMIMVTVNALTLVLVSWFYFKERISLMGLIGIILGLISVTLLELSGD
ncbi:MAG: SMR family transporter [Candidatus Magasanikiibacteriota bacterium]